MRPEQSQPSSTATAAPPAIAPQTAGRIVTGRHGDPFSVLGVHRDGAGWIVRVFVPGAEAARLLSPQGSMELACLHRDGLFGARLDEHPGRYEIAATRGADRWSVIDPYQFGPVLGELDEHLLAEGTHWRLWDILGAHPREIDGVDGTVFAVWAPNALRVSVVGDFNDWDGRRHVMRGRGATGIWEIFVPGVGAGARYKYEILGPDGTLLPPKADPVGFRAELRPDNCSVVAVPLRPATPTRRAQTPDRPISIYEVHLGSWWRHGDGRWLSYRELAENLVPYVRDMGFTHIEVLPVTEHPFDGSWGYQPVGLFAPTSRFGTPEEFRLFVDACHAAGLGLILDWVPAHFPGDDHGLGRFDGTALYEHADPREGRHKDWDTLIYNYGRREVQNFLIANALYWLKVYGADGLRVDAVASMLYRDYSRADGEWVPNVHGGRENLEAIEFLKRLNTVVYGESPSIATMAEESTSWAGVSRPVDAGGLGFGYKWNMGWMHDTLEYIGKDPLYRAHHHDKMTFGLLYAFSENFILPLSHDEVVHGKGSILGRMPGTREQKLANLRAYYGFMYAHPGKKLMFMGQEFGQPTEWDHEAGLPWHILDDPAHAGVQALVRDLNQLYRDVPALHAKDADPDGFQWLDGGAAEDQVFAWLRRGDPGDRPVVAVSNFSGREHTGWRIGVPDPGFYVERLNTDAGVYGGGGLGNLGGVMAEPLPHHGQAHSIGVTLPPLSTLYFQLKR